MPVLNFSDEFVDDVRINTDNSDAKTAHQNIYPSARMGTRPIPTGLYDMIGTFKSLTQNEYAFHVRNNGWLPFRKRLWQLRFHDHVIRNHDELDRIREYIIDNLINWMKDENNLDNIKNNKTADS